MNHIDEEMLELYVLQSRKVENRRGEIEAHLNECAGCEALHREIKEYHAEAEQIREEEARANSQALTVRGMLVKMPPHVERGPMHDVPMTVPVRVVLFIIRHPVGSSIGFVAFCLAGLLALSQLTFEWKDPSPSYARAKNEFLVAYNKDGDELWKKHIGSSFEIKETVPENPEQLLTVFDVDRDGTNEVLSIFGWAGGNLTTLKNVVLCYSADGSERWKYEFHRTMVFGQDTMSDDYKMALMLTGDFDTDGNSDLVVYAHHTPSWPSVLVRLDARTGRTLSEYWHAGYIHSAQHRDINGDGIEELFFAGENNGLKVATMLVLDPRHMKGYAPMPDEFAPSEFQKGSEKFFVSFPGTDLEELEPFRQRQADRIQFKSDGLAEIRYGFQILGTRQELYFYFDTSMSCVKVLPSDAFIELHQKMEFAGKLAKRIDGQYIQELRQGVRYWNGEEFVKEPTMNSRYSERVSAYP